MLPAGEKGFTMSAFSPHTESYFLLILSRHYDTQAGHCFGEVIGARNFAASRSYFHAAQSVVEVTAFEAAIYYGMRRRGSCRRSTAERHRLAALPARGAITIFTFFIIFTRLLPPSSVAAALSATREY